MASDLWSAVDAFFDQSLGGDDEALAHALALSAQAGLPAIQVAPNQGRLLGILARAIGARRILEVGTLGGYSAIHLARALPVGGRLVTLELEERHAQVARAAIAHAGLAERVEVRVGRALDALPRLVQEGAGPFDLVFIDADKPSSPDYMAWALRLTRPGSMIIVDNVVRGGAVAEAASTDANVVGVRRLAELLSTQAQVLACAVQTVGVKGHDGLLVALVAGAPISEGARGPTALAVSAMASADVEALRQAFVAWGEAATAKFERYQSEQAAGQRQVLIARLDGAVVGYATVWWASAHLHHGRLLPEIRDFNVLPHHQGQGIGSRLLAEAEALVRTRSDHIGIGVGLHSGYGRAQRLYVRRGYVPDGRGVIWRDQVVPEGAPIANDDDLELRFVKTLR